MSKFKIEKVEHRCSSVYGKCLIIDYYPVMDILYQFCYHSPFFAKSEARNSATIGIWRIKSLKNN